MRAKNRKKIQKVRVIQRRYNNELELISFLLSDPIKTLVHEYFEGVLTNETKCMMCETVSTPNLQCTKLTRV